MKYKNLKMPGNTACHRDLGICSVLTHVGEISSQMPRVLHDCGMQREGTHTQPCRSSPAARLTPM